MRPIEQSFSQLRVLPTAFRKCSTDFWCTPEYSLAPLREEAHSFLRI